MTEPISVLVVDDHAMVRGTLGRYLNAEPDMRVVASVSNADRAVVEATRLKPDIILMDIDMPGRFCFEAVQTIRSMSRDTRVIFLSAFFHDRYIQQALGVQAWGYVTKGESEQALIEAIRAVSSGEAYFSPEVQARIVVDTSGARLRQGTQTTRTNTLTDREMQVLQHVARGMLRKVVAKTLGISAHTVDRHLTALMDKLDIHDRVELTRFAIREGLADA